MDYFPYLVAAVGVLVSLSGVRRLIATRRFETRAASAGAEVIDVREEWVQGNRGQRHLWIPVVRFTTGDGRTVEAETTPHRGFGRPHAGDPLEVLYDPSNAADVRVRTGAAGLLSSVGSIAVGLVFALLALTFFAR